MKAPFILASLLWPTGLGAAFFGLILHDRNPILAGEIVFERISTCDYVSLKTTSGIVLLEVDQGLVEIASGQRLSGRFGGPHQMRPMNVDDRANIDALVIGWDNDLLRAKDRFDSYCGPEPFRSTGAPQF